MRWKVNKNKGGNNQRLYIKFGFFLLTMVHFYLNLWILYEILNKITVHIFKLSSNHSFFWSASNHFQLFKSTSWDKNGFGYHLKSQLYKQALEAISGMFLARARQTHFSSYLPIYFREKQNIGKSFNIFHIATAFLICFLGRACESLSYVCKYLLFYLPCCLCIKFQGIDFFRREIQNEIHK